MHACGECGLTFERAGYCPRHGCALVPVGADPDDDMSGITLGRYQLVRPIGEGGSGRVYAAFDGERRVAVKVLADRSARCPVALERFLAEARAAALLQHPNIVGVIDQGVFGRRPFIVMELVEGRTLRRARRELALPELLGAMTDVLSALEAAHGAGIVHRDLKPDNIVVTPPGRAVVLDFGIAKVPPAAGELRLTDNGAVLGTPEYMAPEQVAGARDVDGRADLYAAGVVLYELIAGERPFVGATFDVLRAHVETAPPPLRARRPIPASLERVVMTALAKHPDRRYQTAGAMACALAGAIEDLAAPAPREIRETPPAFSAVMSAVELPRHRARWAIAGVAFVAVFAAAVIALRSSPASTAPAALAPAEAIAPVRAPMPRLHRRGAIVRPAEPGRPRRCLLQRGADCE